MMWSKHSRRIDPISHSAKPFCQGEAGAIGLSRMPMCSHSACDDGDIDPIAQRPKEEPRSSGVRSTLRRRVGRDVDPDEVSAINPYNHEPYNSSKPMVGTTNRTTAQCPERG